MSAAREILANNMRSYRAMRGWSQEALALEAGLHRTFIGHVEAGNRNISLDNLERIAIAFGITLSQLLVDAEQ